MMNDQEIIQGLIDRDNRITSRFLFVSSRPLLTSIMNMVFGYRYTYNEMVNELYEYLMEDDCKRLRNFQYRSSVYQWLKVVATRFFIQKRDGLIENESQSYLLYKAADEEAVDTATIISDRMDVTELLGRMKNQRYAAVIRYLILQDMEPEECAALMGVTVDNLYNIKKRAMASLSRIALKYYSYGE